MAAAGIAEGDLGLGPLVRAAYVFELQEVEKRLVALDRLDAVRSPGEESKASKTAMEALWRRRNELLGMLWPGTDPDQEGEARKAASRAVEEQAQRTLEMQGLKPDDAADLVALARKRGEEMSAIDTDEPPQPDTSHGDREGGRP